MFGLKIPIAKSEHEDEFDSVSTILSHSSVARSLKPKQAPPWMTAVKNDGCIFYLELPADFEAKLVRLNNGDGGSVSSLAMGIGCNSEDTGYSSDQDLSSADHNFNIQSKLGNRKKNTSNSIGKLSSNCSKRKSTCCRKSFSHISSSAIYELEKESDDLPLAKSDIYDQAWLDTTQVTRNVFSDQSLLHITHSCLEDDDGVCLRKSDFRSSKASSISSKSAKSDSSLNSVESSKFNIDKSLCTSNTRSGHKSKQVNALTKSFINKVKPEYKFVSVNIQLNSSRNGNSEISDHKIPGLTSCEHLLGIVPVCRDDFDSMDRGQNAEVIVSGVLPGTPASFHPEISVGSVLHSVNSHEINWDNMDSLLSSLRKLKKIKLTMKSLRPGSSPIGLETLVNILTSDTVDLHVFDKVAAMYISLQGVDPNSPDNTNDGMIYSFPSEHNSLHQLLGLFYTLSQLVRDINRSNTIKNTTLSLDGQKIHIAYLQEGNDILVFAMTAMNVSVSQLNNLLMDFSRLLQVLFGSVECAFTKGEHSVFINNILTYLFRQVLSAPVGSSFLSSSMSSTPDLKKGPLQSECCPFVRYSQHVQAMALPDDVLAIVGKTLSEFESSNFADMSEDFYGCRRQYTILGSTFFYCGQLVCSHLAPEDLHDLQLYLGHLGIFDLMARSSVAQFVAWKEVFPTRFCHDVAEINNNFGYSEPNARWCWLIVGLKHGLFCSLLETVGLTPLQQSPLSPDVFYVDQAKACVLQLQTPQLLAVFNIRVNRDSQSPVTKSDYCATYVNTTGEKITRSFSDECKKRTNHSNPLMLSLQSNWHRNSVGSDNSLNSTEVDSLYKSPHSSKIYPGEYDGIVSTLLPTISSLALPNLPVLHKLSTSRHPSIYQYCCLDGLEGTIIVGSDMDNSGIFHAQIVHSFYQCCRQIHCHFVTNGDKHQSLSVHKERDDDDHFDHITSDSNLKGMKEHGILMTFNPHPSEEGHKSKWALEYWVVGRRFKRPSVKEMYVCFNASAPQNMIELAFRLSFGSFS